MDKDTIYKVVKERLVSEFKLASDSVDLDSHLSDDLELDSLDMVDLIMNLSDHIGEKVNPALFKNASTVQDLVELVLPLWK